MSMNGRVVRLAKVGFVLKWLSFIFPSIVVAGWLVGNGVMERLFIGVVYMNPIAALLFALLAGSILLKSTTQPKLNQWLPLIFGLVFIVSCVILLRFVIGFPLQLDHLFFGNVFGDSNDGVNPMAPASAVLFMLISLAKTLRFYNRKAASEPLLILSFTLVLFCITGYAFKVPEFFLSIKLFPALQTCVLFLIMQLAILFSTPEQGLVGLLVTDLEGALIGRNLILFTIIVPIVIAYLRMQAQWSQLISTEMGASIVMSSYIFIFTTSLLLTVASLNKRDRLRKEDAVKINELNRELRNANLKQQELIEELAASNEELAATGENQRATNDELLATNDKLEEAVLTIKMQDEIIIEQKEEALRRSQEHLEIIFSNTEEKILLLDVEGKVLLFNRSLDGFVRQATGRRPNVGMYAWDLVIPAHAIHSKALFQQALKGEAVMQEFPMHVGGQSLVHLVKYEPVWIEDKIKYVTVISLDITEQKDTSAQLKERVDQLQKTNYELDKFVYSVSHDLRAPLSSILGLVNVAELESPKETTYLKMIRGRINTLDNFIKSILDYSRNSRMEVQREEVDFKMLVDTAQDSLRTMNGFSSLHIEVNITQAAPFYSDVVRIGTIFNNLLSNAVRFQDPHKGKSTLQVKVVCKSRYAHILVMDNGIGIAEEHQSKVFDMFYRATQQGVGSGIGLYLVKETVTKLNGTIRLNSRFGEFTEFEIILPNQLSEHQS
jgi:PAS domain S-box-containing protein